MTYDLIVTWPTNCDYPLWRKMIHDNRRQFNEVIVAFTYQPGYQAYTDFVQTQMMDDFVLFTWNPVSADGDWRDRAIKSALLQSNNAEWLWFTEQDFYPRKEFWDEVQSHEENAFAVYQDTRMHPCSLFINKKTLSETSKDFGAKPPEYDHFGRIQKDLERNSEAIGKIKPGTYFHYNGLSHNWRLITDGGEPNWQKETFYGWLHKSLECGVKLHPEWEKTARKALLRE